LDFPIFIDLSEGDPENFNKSFSALQEAIDLSPPVHQNLPRRLNNLSTLFTTRFERKGDRADADQALSLQLRTHALVSDNPIWLNNLGATYLIVSCVAER
jgi:hypothetical protein